jgi:hypothetical protein
LQPTQTQTIGTTGTTGTNVNTQNNSTQPQIGSLGSLGSLGGLSGLSGLASLSKGKSLGLGDLAPKTVNVAPGLENLNKNVQNEQISTLKIDKKVEDATIEPVSVDKQPNIRYVTQEEMSSIIPSFNGRGDMLDQDGNIIKLFSEKKDVKKDEKRDDQKQKVDQTDDTSLKTLKTDLDEVRPVTSAEILNIYDRIQQEERESADSLLQNSNNPYQIIPHGPRRRGLLGKTVDPTKALIQRNYNILSELKKEFKNTQKNDNDNDLDTYHASVNFKEPIWGLNHYDDDNIDEYLSLLNNNVTFESIYKLQQYLHPFEHALGTIKHPLYDNDMYPNEYVIDGDDNNGNNNNNNNNNSGEMNNIDNIHHENCEYDVDNEPYEWWDLKMLSTGELCKAEFEREMETQLKGANSSMNDDDQNNRNNNRNNNDNNNNNNNNNQNAEKKTNHDEISLVFIHPHYPPYNPTTGTFCTTPDNPLGYSFTQNSTTTITSHLDGKEDLSSFRDTPQNNPPTTTSPSKSPWPFSPYISQTTIPNTMYIPKYLPPISTIQSEAVRNANTQITLPLTRSELKKERRIKRKQVREEQELLIKAGIIPRPPQKMRLVTLYRQMQHYNALGLATEFEAAAKQQIQQRLEKHINTNLENMLTPKEKQDKRLRKIRAEKEGIEKGDLSLITQIFRVGTLNSPLIRKNIDMTARHARLTGAMICCRDQVNIVVVQGGERGLKEFSKYVLTKAVYHDSGNVGLSGGMRKIEGENQGEDQLDGDNQNENDGETNAEDDKRHKSRPIDETFGRSPHYDCVELWRGVLSSERAFTRFETVKCERLSKLRSVLEHHDMIQFFDLVMQHVSR